MKRSFIIILGVVFVLSACQKSIEEFTPYAGQPGTGDSTWSISSTPGGQVVSLRNDLSGSVNNEMVDLIPGTTQTFSLNSGLNISITGYLFEQGDTVPVSGPVTVFSFRSANKGDIIRKGTFTRSGSEFLKSGDQFFISMYRGSNLLSLTHQSRLKITYQSPAFSLGQRLYKAEASANYAGFNWISGPGLEVYPLQGTPGSYEITSNTMGWLMTADEADSLRGNINIEAELTPYNTNLNTLAYLVFDGSNTVLPLIPDPTSRKFRISGVASGQAARLVVISKMGGNYYWGMKPFVTGYSGTTNIQNVSVTPRLTSMAAIQANLDAL